MIKKNTFLLFSLILLAQIAKAQIGIGIKAGVNIANQDIKTVSGSIDINNLTAFQLGAVYQYVPKYLTFGRFGLGLETGFLFSQKGSMFEYADELLIDRLSEDELETYIGYNQLNYVEIPLNLHLRLKLGNVSLFGYGGMFGSCLVSAKTVMDETKNDKLPWQYNQFSDRLDYGYSFGFGLDILRRLQLSINWSRSLQDLIHSQPTDDNILGINSVHNRLYSINIAFLF